MSKSHRVLVGLIVLVGATQTFADERLSASGIWASQRGDAIRGTWTADLTSGVGTIQGTISLTGSNVVTQATVQGSISEGGLLTLSAIVDEVEVATFSATISDVELSGTWRSDLVGDEGHWNGELRRE
jgi:hypothetical protein